jgi:hypothetical protein
MPDAALLQAISTGILGILYYGSLFRRMPPATMAALATPLAGNSVAVGTTQAASLPLLGKLLGFFLKAGALTFGSGLVIVGYAVKADIVLVANAGDGTVRLFRGEDLAPVGSIVLGDDADNVRIDASDGSAVVGYGNGGLAIIDPSSQTVIARIGLAAHPEGFQIDPADHRALVNVPDEHQIVVVDLASRHVVDTWAMPSAHANFPMALDPTGPELATVFRNPPRMVLLNRRTGKLEDGVPVVAGAFSERVGSEIG